MKKILSLLIVGIMAISMLAGCGGGSGGSGDGGGDGTGVEGKYISVAMSMMGITMTGEEAAGMAIVLDKGGKGKLEVDGDSGSLSWTLEGDALSIEVEGETISGTLADNVITITNFLDMGMDVMFGLEGTDAVNPENYMSEEEQAFVGTWKSTAVADVLGDDMSGVYAADGMTATFNKDHTATIVVDGVEYTSNAWSVWSNFGSFDEDFEEADGTDLSITFEMNGENLEVTYSGAEYLVYTCSK